MRNHSYENDFDLHENETACRTHFHMKGFALRLVMKQRHKGTRKSPIILRQFYILYLKVSTRAVIGQFSGPYSPVRLAKNFKVVSVAKLLRDVSPNFLII